MGIVQSPQLWTKHALSEELGLPRQRVTKLLRNVPPDGKVQGRHNGWYLATAIPVLFGLDDQDPDAVVDPDKMAPKDRKDWWDGTKTQVMLAKEAGRLILDDDHRRVMAIVIQEIINEFEPFPDLLERDCGASREMVVKAQGLVDRVRQLAYERALRATESG